MKKYTDTVSVLLAGLTIGLMVIAGGLLFRDDRIPRIPDHPGILLLILIIFLLLLQILILFRERR